MAQSYIMYYMFGASENKLLYMDLHYWLTIQDYLVIPMTLLLFFPTHLTPAIEDKEPRSEISLPA